MLRLGSDFDSESHNNCENDLSNFDVYATAGGQDKAVVEQFTATVDALGQIAISFTQGSADNPEVAGIEILGSGTLGQPLSDVLEIDTGRSTAVSPFVADEDFNTGNEASSSATIATTNTSMPAPAAVYQTCRWVSSFTYAIPGLTAGSTYAVRLHFAELTFDGSGERVFNVAINGTNVLSNFDIYATSGSANQAITEQFNAVANSAARSLLPLPLVQPITPRSTESRFSDNPRAGSGGSAKPCLRTTEEQEALRFSVIQVEAIEIACAHPRQHERFIVRGQTGEEVVLCILKLDVGEIGNHLLFPGRNAETKNRLFVAKECMDIKCLAVPAPNWIGGAGVG